MKKYLLSFIALLWFPIFASAQSNSSAHCGTDINFQKQLLADPSLANKLNNVSKSALLLGKESHKSAQSNLRIIPVVFHVIHNGGAENISKAQILDQIATLNLDYMKLNADTVNIRDAFKPRAGLPNIQFRLANIDPNGNCTDGIVRLQSLLTESADDGVKALNYWNSSKYLNIWVVKNIAVDQGQQGTTLGYAQFPGFGAAETDGVVIRADYVGSIGTAANNNNKGRTLTHEIGHILGLFHTFQGACDGGFLAEDIDDTPKALAANFGCNTTINSCTNESPDLPDMTENYMDYSNGDCMSMFTQDQVTKMDGVLAGTRSELVSQSNNLTTGTDDEINPPCAPKALFLANRNFICQGAQVKFSDISFNGLVEARNWTFEGGNPASSTDSTLLVTYDTPGLYTVTLNVSSGLGNDTKIITQYIRVIENTATSQLPVLTEGFELPDADMPIIVENVEDLGGTWQKTTYPFSGSKSYRIVNYNGANPAGAIDYFTFLPVDMTAIGLTTMTFRLAYAQRPGSFTSTESNEKLRILVSSNCGQTWAPRYSKSGASLATTPQTNSGFSPSSPSQWRKETVNLNAYASQEKLLIRFELTSSGGNNLYIDDINIGSPTGENEILEESSIAISPNPATDDINIEFDLLKKSSINITVVDMLGREVKSLLVNKNLGHQNVTLNISELQNGIYTVRINANDATIARKIAIGN